MRWNELCPSTIRDEKKIFHTFIVSCTGKNEKESREGFITLHELKIYVVFVLTECEFRVSENYHQILNWRYSETGLQ